MPHTTLHVEPVVVKGASLEANDDRSLLQVELLKIPGTLKLNINAIVEQAPLDQTHHDTLNALAGFLHVPESIER